MHMVDRGHELDFVDKAVPPHWCNMHSHINYRMLSTDVQQLGLASKSCLRDRLNYRFDMVYCIYLGRIGTDRTTLVVAKTFCSTRPFFNVPLQPVMSGGGNEYFGHFSTTAQY